MVEFSSKTIQDRVASFVIKSVQEKNSDCMVALCNTWMHPYIQKDLYINISEYLITLLKKQIAEESDSHRSIGGFNWGALLSIYLTKLQGAEQKKKALDVLLDYIDADNILAYDRASALHNLTISLSENQVLIDDYKEQIGKICSRYLDIPHKKINDYFLPELDDTDVLAAKAAWMLVRFGCKDPAEVGLAP